MKSRKKVDIITRHAVANYGSILQTYATQKVFRKLGYDSEIINYVRKDEQGKNIALANLKSNRNKKWNKNVLTRLLYKILQIPNYEYSYNCFKKFRSQLLKQTDVFYESLEQLKNNVPEADIYCTGSDQVWTSMGLYQYDEAYFLEFVPEDKACITYASSFGRDEINKDLHENLKRLLKKYSNILVREDSAVDIIENIGLNNVEQVVDPTLLLNREEWEELLNKQKNRENKKYILIYQLQNNKKFDIYAKKLAKKLNLKLIRISPSINGFSKNGNFVYMPNPKMFLNYFKNAEMVITDSFHGTVFSLIFQKKFIDILPPMTGTRIKSILRLVGLEERILDDYNDFSIIDRKIDFNKVTKILNKQREDSLEKLRKTLETVDPNKEFINVDGMLEDYCYGCRACEQLCPTNAITMIQNNEGFLVPYVDKEKCIKCKLCISRCPHYNINNLKSTKKPIAYAAKARDENEQKKSSSGAIFPIIAKYILDNNGAVFGCQFNEKNEAEHIEVKNKKDLEKLRGSKYVQSNTRNTYSRVKEILEEGICVLYSGTPCQIGGLKKYLNKDYGNLYTIDLVCHGVPSPKLFEKYIEWLGEKNNSQVEEFSFRSKENSSWGLYYKYKTKNQKVHFGSANLNPYYKAFLNGDVYREVCYDCQYTTVQRVGDITLADFWGVEKQHPKIADSNGVSAVLINTEKGKKLFNEIENEITYEKSTIDKVKEKNKNLSRPTVRPKIRNNIYDNIDKKDFEDLINNNFHYKAKFSDYIKLYMPKKLKNKLKSIKNKMG